jgi:hypothetical protein
MNRYMGIPVLTNPALCKTVRRTWRERLLTLPWRPLVKTRTEPDPHLYKVRQPEDLYGFVSEGREFYVGHPATVRNLMAAASPPEPTTEGGETDG